MSAPPPQPGAPHAGNPGDLTKGAATVDELKARINSRQPGQPWHQPLFNPFADPVRCRAFLLPLLPFLTSTCCHMSLMDCERSSGQLVSRDGARRARRRLMSVFSKSGEASGGTQSCRLLPGRISGAAGEKTLT